jgi:hypothetical protein
MVFVMEKEYVLCEVGECNSDKYPSKPQRGTLDFPLTLPAAENCHPRILEQKLIH